VSTPRGAGPILVRARILRIVPAPNVVTDADEFALDPAMPPARILSSHAHDQILDIVTDRGTRPVRIRPTPPDQAMMQGQQGRRGHDAVVPHHAGQ
jgi:hypothetical protein